MSEIAKERLLFLKMLRDERVSRNMSQEDLANRLDVTQSIVSKSESGDRQMDFLELRDFCNVLDIKLEVFVKKFEKELLKLKNQ